MKKILILSLILATSCLSQVYAETEVYNKIELTQKGAAKKIIGKWKVSDLSLSRIDERIKEIYAQMVYIITSSKITIKITGQEEQKYTYLIKRFKKDILTIALTNTNEGRTIDQPIRLTKEGIALLGDDNSKLLMNRIENK